MHIRLSDMCWAMLNRIFEADKVHEMHVHFFDQCFHWLNSLSLSRSLLPTCVHKFCYCRNINKVAKADDAAKRENDGTEWEWERERDWEGVRRKIGDLNCPKMHAVYGICSSHTSNAKEHKVQWEPEQQQQQQQKTMVWTKNPSKTHQLWIVTECTCKECWNDEWTWLRNLC